MKQRKESRASTAQCESSLLQQFQAQLDAVPDQLWPLLVATFPQYLAVVGAVANGTRLAHQADVA